MDLAAKYPRIHVSLVMPEIVNTDFARHAAGNETLSNPQQARQNGPMTQQTAEEVAQLIEDLIEHPRSELCTNPASPEIVRRYFQDVEAFEAYVRQSVTTSS